MGNTIWKQIYSLFIPNNFQLLNEAQKVEVIFANSQTKSSNENVRVERFIEFSTGAIQIGEQRPSYEFLQVLTNEQFNSKLLKTSENKNFTVAWKKAMDLISNQEEKLKESINTFGKESVIAAMAYTLHDPPMFAEFNKFFRIHGNKQDFENNLETGTENREKAFLKFMPYLPLVRHLVNMQWKIVSLGKEQQLPLDIILYRGSELQLEAEVGKVFTICNFTSTSMNRQLAEMFTEKVGTLLKFTGYMSGIQMTQMSYFPGEEEVLLFPFQTFVVTEILQVGDKIEITLLSRTEQALEKFTHIDKLFPFQLDTLEKCFYNLYDDETVYSFNSANLCQYNYTPSKVKNDTKLPDCHIIGITFGTFDLSTYPNSEYIMKLVVLIPNIQILINCFKENKKVYFKNYTAQFKVKQFDTGKFKINGVEINCFSNSDVQNLIRHCQRNDFVGNATSFVIGDDIDGVFWENFLKQGFPEHLSQQIKVCIVNLVWPGSENNFTYKRQGNIDQFIGIIVNAFALQEESV